MHFLPEAAPERQVIAAAVEAADCAASAPLLFLQVQLGTELGLSVSSKKALLGRPGTASTVSLDNLKTATPWVLKAAGVEYLLDQVERDGEGLFAVPRDDILDGST